MPKEENPASSKPEKCECPPPETTNPVDLHIGARLRLRRTLLGFTQEQLAEFVGLSNQQIERFERADSRITGARLFEFGQILDVPVTYFFDDMPDELKMITGHDEAAPYGGQDDGLQSKHREASELIKAYYKITDQVTRQSVYKLLKSLA